MGWTATGAGITIVGVIVILLAVHAGAGTSASTTGTPASPPSSLAPAIDGITCQEEMVQTHFHAHLTLIDNGQTVALPGGIGIRQSAGCLYWLHTHAADGIIHIESPVQRAFTLGEFFDVWGQSLSRTQVGPASGNVTALVDGKVWLGDPRDIPLKAHRQIQLEVGTPLVAQLRIKNWHDL